jgi:polygalacturonase
VLEVIALPTILLAATVSPSLSQAENEDRVEASSPVVNVCDIGAAPDGKTLCTDAIQTAIDRASELGGGTVYFPPGTYLSGTVNLKSHVRLHLDAGATLLGSTKLEDYPPTTSKVASRANQYNIRSLIKAEDLDRIAIVGQGTLDGNGGAFMTRNHDGTRPLLLRVINCRDVILEDIHMRNSGFWNQHFLACERVRLRGIRVWNHATYNNDGVDIDGCKDVIVTQCYIDSDDDALCLKSTSDLPCENVVISDCVISSHCNAIKMGTDSTGGFVNVTITNCTITSPRASQVLYGLQRGISGISLELVDGGRMDRIAVSNVTIDGVEVPLFVRLGDRGTGFRLSSAEPSEKRPVGTLRNVSLANIIATGSGKTGCSFVGVPEHEIENISMSNITIRCEGGGERAWSANAVPELADRYPESTMFGGLPAYGLYCRHVKGLTLTDVRLLTEEPDPRHALVLDDVQSAGVSNLVTSYATGAAPLLRLVGSRDVLIRGCSPNAPEGVFLRIEGNGCAAIALLGNDLSRVGRVSEFGGGADSTSLRCVANIDPTTQ